VINTTPSSTLTPFQLSGTLSIIAFGGGTLFDDAVFGSGTATWGFVLAPDGTPVVSRVRYQFEDVAPTPEPATLVLLASGLGVVAARRNRPNRIG
jgi:PEP-CTERM motif